MRDDVVKDWMTADVLTVSSDISVIEADEFMAERQIRRLLVVENDKLVGIVSLGDVREGKSSKSTFSGAGTVKLKKIMTRDPITISEDATIALAAQTMLSTKVSGLPVVDANGKLAGIITESDIFRMVVQEWGRTAE